MSNYSNQAAPHEIFELHELLAAEIISAKKLQANLERTNNQELKEIIHSALQAKLGRIKEMQQLSVDIGITH